MASEELKIKYLVYGWIRNTISSHTIRDINNLIFLFAIQYDQFQLVRPQSSMVVNKDKMQIAAKKSRLWAYGRNDLYTSITHQKWSWTFAIEALRPNPVPRNPESSRIEIGLHPLSYRKDVWPSGPSYSLITDGSIRSKTDEERKVIISHYCPPWGVGDIITMKYDDGKMSFEINGTSYGICLNLLHQPDCEEMYRLRVYLQHIGHSVTMKDFKCKIFHLI